MFTLTKNDSSLIITTSSKFDYTIESFLIRKQFKPYIYNKQYVLHDNISGNIIMQIVSFFEEYDEPIGLDYECRQLCDSVIKQNEEFEELKKEGLRIKYEKTLDYLYVPYIHNQCKLKPYQINPVRHALKLGHVANFSVPGSGKTWMSYATYFLMKSKHYNMVEKLLIIGPLSSFKPWEIEYREMTKKSPKLIRISGNERQRDDIFKKSAQYEIFLIGYTMAAHEKDEIINMLKHHKFLVIVDESHHIKNPNASSTIAILEIAQFAYRRMILTGTMIPHSLKDLWSQFTFLYPNRNVLGSLEQFEYDLGSDDALTTIQKKLAPFFMRISKKDLHLPLAKSEIISIPMGKYQKRIYSAIGKFIIDNDENYRDDRIAMQKWRKNSILYLLMASTDPSLLTMTTHFKEESIKEHLPVIFKILNNYAVSETPKKLEMAKRLVINDMHKSQKVIIWCNFTGTINKMFQILKGYNPLIINGAVPKDDEQNIKDNRESRIEKFQTNSRYNILIANPASLAESISLHKVCHHAIYVDRTFNGGNYLQSLERIHRIGTLPNTKTKYTFLMTIDSIDYDVDDSLKRKKSRMDKFLKEDDLITTTNIDLEFDNPFGDEDDLDVDYSKVLQHLRGS